MVQLHGKKPVVYLDQNWMSNITKAHYGEGRIEEKQYFSNLFEVLLAGVAINRFVCPTSDFHEYEASLGSRVKDTLWRVTGRLSRHLSFNNYFPVMHRQLLQAVTEFVGQDTNDAPWWFTPFNEDPDIPTPESDPYFNIVHIPLVDEYWEGEKRRRDDVQTSIHREFKRATWRENLDYLQAVALQQKRFFIDFYLRPLEVLRPGYKMERPLNFLELIGLSDVHKATMQLWTKAERGGGLEAFLDSPQFSKVPFLSNHAKLVVADKLKFPNRKVEPSLQDDFRIAAMVIPYSKVFATENYLAELIKQTGISEKYDCDIYTMRQKQDLLSEITRLVLL